MGWSSLPRQLLNIISNQQKLLQEWKCSLSLPGVGSLQKEHSRKTMALGNLFAPRGALQAARKPQAYAMLQTCCICTTQCPKHLPKRLSTQRIWSLKSSKSYFKSGLNLKAKRDLCTHRAVSPCAAGKGRAAQLFSSALLLAPGLVGIHETSLHQNKTQAHSPWSAFKPTLRVF